MSVRMSYTLFQYFENIKNRADKQSDVSEYVT